jgi:hypothetical protein
VFTVALGACSQSQEPTLPSAAGPGASSGASAPASTSVVAAYIESVRAWAKCMRDAGFDTSDPDARGEVKFGGDMAKNKADPKFMAAQLSCQKLRLPTPKELIDRGPAPSAQLIAARRAYAKCVRDHGVPSFADPDAEGYGPEPDSSVGPKTAPTEDVQQMAVELRATEFCRPVLDGKPPATPDPNATGVG